MAVRGIRTRAPGTNARWRKPVGGLGSNVLNRGGHNLARNLLSAVVFDGPAGIGGAQDYCLNKLTAAGTPTWGVGQYGNTVFGPNNGDGLTYASRLGGSVAAWSFTALCKFDGTSGPTGGALLSGGPSGVMVSTFNANTSFQVGDGTAGGGALALTQTSAGLTGWHRITVTVSASQNVRFFVDGVLNQSGAANLPMTGTGPGSIVGDTFAGSLYGNQWTWPVADAFYWNRTLSDQEVFQQFARPYEMIVADATVRDIVNFANVSPNFSLRETSQILPRVVRPAAGPVVPLLPLQAAETVTLDKWFQPLPQPVRGKVATITPAAAAPVLSPESVSLDKWFQPLTQPLRQVVRPITPAAAAPVLTPENVTLDKWYQPLPQPLRTKPPTISLAGGGPILSLGVITLAWAPDLSQPLRTRAPSILPAAAAPVLSALAPETVTLDKWFQPLPQPTRRTRAVPGDAIARAPTVIVAAPPVTDMRWFQPLSQPVRRTRIPPAAFVTLARSIAPVVSSHRSIVHWID